ncbi:MAG: HK97 family phage prohead protease [Gammaproteobacteria bacterium]|nr:HK97 family phage prohead protease [Gammaproteobacteria bacterium]MDE0366269.1 HK97 family phage prohead protease [Gammaproteobacteria bacterium]
MSKPEYRYAELRADVEGRTLEGTVMTYGDTATLPFGKETVSAGAFGDLSSADVILNEMHDRARPLARTGSGLELVDSAEQLTIRATLPETRAANDVLELIKAGVYRGLSVEMFIRQSDMVNGIRRVTEARLGGIGVVDKPAYPQSAVSARSEAETDNRWW